MSARLTHLVDEHLIPYGCELQTQVSKLTLWKSGTEDPVWKDTHFWCHTYIPLGCSSWP